MCSVPPLYSQQILTRNLLIGKYNRPNQARKYAGGSSAPTRIAIAGSANIERARIRTCAQANHLAGADRVLLIPQREKQVAYDFPTDGKYLAFDSKSYPNACVERPSALSVSQCHVFPVQWFDPVLANSKSSDRFCSNCIAPTRRFVLHSRS